MTIEPDHSKSAARALRPRSPVEVPDSPDARHAIVSAMESAMQAAKRDELARSRRWVTFAAAAAVLGVVSTGAVWLRASMRPASTTVMATPTSQGMLTAPGQRAQALISGVGLPEASRLTTPPSGAATLDFSTGTHVTLGGGAELTLEAVDARQRLYLATGRLDAKVAHVANGSSFVVATRDAEVEVKGTAFSVEVVPGEAECERGATTRVTVTEGVVSVRFAGQEVLLHGGEQWPLCAAPTDDSTEASGLAAQNDLFAQAVELKKHQDPTAAIAVFEHLMQAWPKGPLAESAAVERMKLLAAGDHAEGAAAARAYLTKYPQGFARDEARGILKRK